MAALLNPFAYRRAIVRALSPNFAAAAIRSGGASVAIDQGRAEAQHDAYVKALKNIVSEVVVLPASKEYPDSCFVEDTAVSIGDVSLITAPGADSRKGEVEEIAAALKDLGQKVVRTDGAARLDGGDVLFTGTEVFVGVTGRTNAAGVAAVQRAFPGLPVTPLFLSATPADTGKHQRNRRRELSLKRQALLDRAAGKSSSVAAAHAAGDHSKCNHDGHHHHHHDHHHPLHLKSIMSLITPGTIAVADTEFARAAAFAIMQSTKRSSRAYHTPYKFLLTPDEQASNAVFANGVLLHRKEFPDSAAVFLEHLKSEGIVTEGPGSCTVALDVSELAKADGALTCCSLLLH